MSQWIYDNKGTLKGTIEDGGGGGYGGDDELFEKASKIGAIIGGAIGLFLDYVKAGVGGLIVGGTLGAAGGAIVCLIVVAIIPYVIFWAIVIGILILISKLWGFKF